MPGLFNTRSVGAGFSRSCSASREFCVDRQDDSLSTLLRDSLDLFTVKRHFLPGQLHCIRSAQPSPAQEKKWQEVWACKFTELAESLRPVLLITAAQSPRSFVAVWSNLVFACREPVFISCVIVSWDLAAHLLDQQFALAEPLSLQSAVTWTPPTDGQGFPTDTDAKRAQDLCGPRATEYGLILVTDDQLARDTR